MTKVIKFIGIINLMTVGVIWLPMLADIEIMKGPNALFVKMDNIFRSILILCILYGLQGLLVLVKKVGKWDLMASAIVFLTSIALGIILKEPLFLIAVVPISIYFLLQIRRARIPDNFKILYLNVWNVVLLTIRFLNM